jgi:putative colanic acid biosynthesis UDP-glucose lipid carrier transferase
MSALATTLARQPERLAFALRLADVALLAAAAQAASLLRYGHGVGAATPSQLLQLCAACALALALLPKFGLYALDHVAAGWPLVGALAAACAAVLAGAAAFGALIGGAGALSRMWLALWYALALTVLCGAHLTARALLRHAWRGGLARIRVLIIGNGAADELCRRVRQAGDGRYQIQAVCRTGAGRGHAPPGIDRVACPRLVADYVARFPVEQIWLALPLSDGREIVALQYLLRNTLVDIRWVQDIGDLQILNLTMRTLFGYPVMDLNCLCPDPWRRVEKYLFDQAVALCALLLLAPLMLLIAVAIRLDSPGPVIFVQPRVGLNGRPFNVYKFRSMRVQDDAAAPQARRADPRVTAVGRCLRRTSLDELPQFFNVLRGEMSVVGPRPHALSHTELYRQLLDVYMVRHRAKPGITGWAQINGARGETDTPDKMIRRVQFDLYYMQHWSIWMDLRIVLWTACKGWTGKQVY